MRTLVIDSATEACSVALFEGDSLVDGRFEILGRGHAERLVPMIRELPGKGRAAHIAVALGPGSFTGVRVGLAAARALAFAWGARLSGYPTLAMVAAMARNQTDGGPVGIAMTGGHGEWFVQGFDARGKPARALASLNPDEAVATTREHVVAGSEAETLVQRRGSGQALAMLPDARAFPALPGHAILSTVAPLYGRGPDARLPATTA